MLLCELREWFEYRYATLCLHFPGNSLALPFECPSLKAKGYQLPPITCTFHSVLDSQSPSQLMTKDENFFLQKRVTKTDTGELMTLGKKWADRLLNLVCSPTLYFFLRLQNWNISVSKGACVIAKFATDQLIRHPCVTIWTHEEFPEYERCHISPHLLHWWNVSVVYLDTFSCSNAVLKFIIWNVIFICKWIDKF